MATTYRIAVIGSWESVMGFRALGLETYPVTAPEEARETIRELAKSGDCGIIYLTEQLAKDLPDVLDRYNAELRPAIILIPGREGSLGIGMNNIQQSIQRAVGADILEENRLTPLWHCDFRPCLGRNRASCAHRRAKPVSRCCRTCRPGAFLETAPLFRLWRRFGCFP